MVWNLRVMEFGSLDGGDVGEHNGVGFMRMFRIFGMEVAFFFGMESFDTVLATKSAAHPHWSAWDGVFYSRQVVESSLDKFSHE